MSLDLLTDERDGERERRHYIPSFVLIYSVTRVELSCHPRSLIPALMLLTHDACGFSTEKLHQTCLRSFFNMHMCKHTVRDLFGHLLKQ